MSEVVFRIRRRCIYLPQPRVFFRLVLQCIAVCCSALQCHVVCCGVFQSIVGCCSVLQCVAVCCSFLKSECDSCISRNRKYSFVWCCSVLWCVAVWSGVFQRVVGRCIVLWWIAVCCIFFCRLALQCVIACCRVLHFVAFLESDCDAYTSCNRGSFFF